MRVITTLLFTACALILAPTAHAATPADACGGDPARVIPALEIPAVVSPPVTVPDQHLGGHLVPGFTIGGVDIPAQVVPAQCIEVADAPPGCLGAITVPARTVPGLELPTVTIPAIDVPGFHRDAVVIDGVTRAPAIRPAEITPAVCAPARASAVSQSSRYDPGRFRSGAYRAPIHRAPVCLEGSCLLEIDGPSLVVDAVSDHAVDSLHRELDESTPTELAGGCTSVLTGAGRAAHVLCPKELFARGGRAVRRAAARTLRVVATLLKRRHPRRVIRVDAHVHNAGSHRLNRRASVRQANTVKRWLVRRAGLSARRVVARGYGDAWPAARQVFDAGDSRVVVSAELE